MKRKLFRIDWWLLTPVFILILISLTVLFSVNPIFFRSQIVALILGIIALFFFSQINLELLRGFAKSLYIGSVIIFFIILILGFESHGAVRWIEVLGIQFQFSEICKPLLAISLAAFVTDTEHTTIRSFFFFFLLLSPLVLFLILQPDLGNALLYIGISLLTLISYGYPLEWFAIGLIPLVLASPLVWTSLHTYQRQRISTFLHPKKDVLGSSYNVIQAVIAVGSGLFMGKGLGQGTQSALRFLPERQTDFIFATLSEGLGFIGAGVVLVAFLFLCLRIYRIYVGAEEPFYKVLVICLLFTLLLHIFVNIGMNIGLLPIVGITLPFVSLGGSSLLSNMILIGILSNISTSQKAEKVLEIR